MLDAIDAIRLYREPGELPPRVRDVWLMWHIMVIGEAANALLPEVLEAMPDVRWSQIIAMRHRLAHEYFAIEMRYVENVVRHELDPLEERIRTYLLQGRAE
jgi:uncharacterized protein with HEPN domain